jgi:hypothetical protein
MKIDNETLVVLDSCRVEGNVLFLPPIQLERKLYEKINKCIESIGGKWNKSKKGHVFDNDPTDMLDNILIQVKLLTLKKSINIFLHLKILQNKW